MTSSEIGDCRVQVSSRLTVLLDLLFSKQYLILYDLLVTSSTVMSHSAFWHDALMPTENSSVSL